MVCGGVLRTFTLELNDDEWESADSVVRFDRDVRGCLMKRSFPEESYTYDHLDFETMETTRLTEGGQFPDNAERKPVELIYQVACNGNRGYACVVCAPDRLRVVSMPDRTVVLEKPLEGLGWSVCELTDEVVFFDYHGILHAYALSDGSERTYDSDGRRLTSDMTMVFGSTWEGGGAAFCRLSDGAALELSAPEGWRLEGVWPKDALPLP